MKQSYSGVPWLKVFLAILSVAFMFTSYRIYQETTAFTHGLDYFSTEFQTYWMRLLWVQLAVIFSLGSGTVGYLWLTRERDFSVISAREEMRRLFVLMGSLLVFSVIAYFSTSLFTEADAAWHQVTIRDTDFTPTHIGLFYFAIPIVVFWSFATFAYAHTRIPMYANRVSIPFAILCAGAFMIMPNVGFNEWGHTFFYAEELFAAPIHWGFVTLGWSTFAVGGVLAQILSRMVELTRDIAAQSTAHA